MTSPKLTVHQHITVHSRRRHRVRERNELLCFLMYTTHRSTVVDRTLSEHKVWEIDFHTTHCNSFIQLTFVCNT